MPTLVKSDVSKYLVLKDTNMYLSNDCSEHPDKSRIFPPINGGDNIGANVVFHSKRALFFAESELVGAAPDSIAIFVLAHEDRDVAKFIVVSTHDVVVLDDTAITGMKIKLRSKRFHYEDVLPF